jgi:hypothetical protein
MGFSNYPLPPEQQFAIHRVWRDCARRVSSRPKACASCDRPGNNGGRRIVACGWRTRSYRLNTDTYAQDLERKLMAFRQYYNRDRVHLSLGGGTPEEVSVDSQPRRAKLSNYSWVPHCNGLFQTPIAA